MKHLKNELGVHVLDAQDAFGPKDVLSAFPEQRADPFVGFLQINCVLQ